MVEAEHPGLHNGQISQRLGELWTAMSEELKQPWKDQAEEVKRQHALQHPGYKYRPRRKTARAAGKQAEVQKQQQVPPGFAPWARRACAAIPQCKAKAAHVLARLWNAMPREHKQAWADHAERMRGSQP